MGVIPSTFVLSIEIDEIPENAKTISNDAVFLGFRYLRHNSHIAIILRVYSSRQRITIDSVASQQYFH